MSRKQIKQPKYVSQSTYKNLERHREYNSLPSETVPNMTLSLRELIDRYTRGQEIPSLKAVYDSELDHEMPDLTYMSKIDREYALHEVKLGISQTQKKLLDSKTKHEANVKNQGELIKLNKIKHRAEIKAEVAKQLEIEEEIARTKAKRL